LTVDGTESTGYYQAIAKYVDPISADYCYGTTNISPENVTKCGFLYNYAAASANSAGNNGGIQQRVTTSICPANWRLPSATSATSGPADGDSSNYADFTVLNASMNAGSRKTPGVSDNYYAGWQPTGSFRGVFQGGYGAFEAVKAELYGQGVHGFLWSSRKHSHTYRSLGFSIMSDNVRISFSQTYGGAAVRCVIGS
jgi:uncharacterized protein (TIGR02145 family)